MVCANVLCCVPDAAAIEATMRKALSPSFAPVAASAVSPYGGGDTSGKICAVLQHFDFTKSKVFMTALCRNLTPKERFGMKLSSSV